MTTLLETAFKKVSALPEIESEKKWDSAFSESEDLLSQMADDALEKLEMVRLRL